MSSGKEQYKDSYELYHKLSDMIASTGCTPSEAHAEAFRQLQERYPEAVAAGLIHADYLISAGHNHEAESLLQKQLQRESNSTCEGMTWEKLGLLQLARDARQTALASLEIALSLRDTYGTRRMICLALYGMGRMQDTVNQLYLMLSLYHRVDRELLMILADCHVKTDEPEDAIMVFHQVLMSDPHNLRAHEMLQQLKWRIQPGRRTDLVELPEELPSEYITLQSFAMEHNKRWQYWQEVIDELVLPVILLASDRVYHGTTTYSTRINNRTLFRIMMDSHLHLTEYLFSRRYAEVLELPVLIVGSHESSTIFNTARVRHLSEEASTVATVLEEIHRIAPACLRVSEPELT